mmetsp:Transcript_56619/g.120448  ORF Transcript_56619/g.120448 Transcript_56619/m.120448 type:complete len:512 (-) Transcript_56619:173-1708(-)
MTDSSCGKYKFGFVFGQASGHINPSLPIARTLVKQGHEVHYLTRTQMRKAVEDTGATFHSDLEWETELYGTREADVLGAFGALKSEFGIPDAGFAATLYKLRFVAIELMLPGLLRWLQAQSINAILYCPIVNPEAEFAAKALNLPSVSLLTLAGPGSITLTLETFLEECGDTPESLRREIAEFQPHREAAERLSKTFKMDFGTSEMALFKVLGKLGELDHDMAILVTTCEDLQDPMTPELKQEYERLGTRFESVGPLLDEEGAERCGGHTLGSAAQSETGANEDIVQRVRMARQAGRPTVLASMGTVVTGDNSTIGWRGRQCGPDGTPMGLSGKELCQAAWQGTFDAFGADSSDAGALIVVALGPQEDALEGINVPRNATCMKAIPQVDLLRAGIDVFLTHGGQNSFTESLYHATPVVVCPGGGDQALNARKALALGAGLEVPRPYPQQGEERAAAEKYRADVAKALLTVQTDASYKKGASDCAQRLRQVGGVPRAAAVMVEAAEKYRPSP